MTVETLIAQTLHKIWEEHYMPRTREFHRDKTALTKCIARYGHHCKQRGWHLDAEFIRSEIMSVLTRARKQKAEIKYLPAYLDAALTRSLGQRAEELSAEAKSVGTGCAKILRDVTGVTAIVQPTAVEILSTIYKNEKRRKPKAVATGKQQNLL